MQGRGLPRCGYLLLGVLCGNEESQPRSVFLNGWKKDRLDVDALLEEIGRPDDNLLHLDTNLRYGCTILKFYLDKEKGDLRRALGRYNGSLGKRKYPNKVIDKLSKKWFQA